MCGDVCVCVLWEAVCDWLFLGGWGGYGRVFVIGYCLSILFACTAPTLAPAPFKGFPVEFNRGSSLQTEVTSQVRKRVHVFCKQ